MKDKDKTEKKGDSDGADDHDTKKKDQSQKKKIEEIKRGQQIATLGHSRTNLQEGMMVV